MKLIFAILYLTVLASCSGESQQASAPIKEHVWKDMTDTIDKAKGVDALTDEAAQRQRRAIEAATQ